MQPILRRLLFITVLFLGLIWIYFSRVETFSLDVRKSAPQRGFPAPEFSLPSLDRSVITLADYKGNPVIINFWASWCPPCKAEMPIFETIQDYYGDSITILAVNATYQDSIENVEAFIFENEITLTTLIDIDGAVNKLYRISALPTTFFIDSSGLIRDIVVGGALSESGLHYRIETLLGVDAEE